MVELHRLQSFLLHLPTRSYACLKEEKEAMEVMNY
jgi:hypothetical protein